MIVQLFTKEDIFLERFQKDISQKEVIEFLNFIREKFEDVKLEGAEVNFIYMSEKVYKVFVNMIELSSKIGSSPIEFKLKKSSDGGYFMGAKIIISKISKGDIVFSSNECGEETVSE